MFNSCSAGPIFMYIFAVHQHCGCSWSGASQHLAICRQCWLTNEQHMILSCVYMSISYFILDVLMSSWHLQNGHWETPLALCQQFKAWNFRAWGHSSRWQLVVGESKLQLSMFEDPWQFLSLEKMPLCWFVANHVNVTILWVMCVSIPLVIICADKVECSH